MKNKNWKRLMALALSAVMLVPAPASHASQPTADNFEEGVETDDGIVPMDDSEGSGMSEEGNETDLSDFSIYGETLYGYYGDAAEVVIPNGVTCIADSAFQECVNRANITSIRLPSGVADTRPVR